MKTALPSCLALLAATLITASAADDKPVPRGFSIPLIDLDAQAQRQVVVDREAGQYLGHVTTVLLEDKKTMIAVYPKGHGRGAIVMKRSTDGGRTWSGRLPTPKSWETSREVPTLYRVVDANGKKRLIMFSGLYPVRMAVSEDDGASWSELKSIGNFGGVVAMASCIKLHDGAGRYMALFHDDGRFLRGGPDDVYGSPYTKHKGPPKFVVYKTLSSDGGLTWSDPEAIATHPTAHLCEPGAVRSPDGKQIAVLLRENSRKHNAFVIFSNDEGRTWTEPREVPGALTGDRHTAAYAPDGRLVIAFRDMCHESPTKGDFVAWVGTCDDIINGREGQYRLRLKDNKKGSDTTYPGVEVLPDGTFVVTTYGHWVEGESPFILSVRFKLEELDAMAKDSALLSPVVNISPGPEYADSTRIFQGIPGIERARNGRLWALWYAGGPNEPGEGPGNYVVLVTSGDDGKKWSKPRLVIDPSGPVRAYDPTLWHDPKGRLWLFWAQSYQWWDGRSGVWAITTENSGDENPKWSAPRRLCNGIMMNKPTVLHSGEWLLPAAVWERAGNKANPPSELHDLAKERGANVIASKDEGATWSLLGQAIVPKRVFDEHMIVERRDGSLWMLVRAAYGIGESNSTNRGKTWSEGQQSAIPHVNSRFFIRRLVSGKLLLVRHNPPDNKTRSHLTAYLSDDDGKTWQGGLMLDERKGVSYPDGVQAPDGTIYVIYDYNRIADKQILMAVFMDEDVAKGQCVSSRARLRVQVNQATGQRPAKR
ncbi:MAG: exo-alpha-sialidase [Verrucomicrobia bacterium]|nr:exo-alpha-sialidase [Verrucomicrobiota bacterium]